MEKEPSLLELAGEINNPRLVRVANDIIVAVCTAVEKWVDLSTENKKLKEEIEELRKSNKE